MREAAPPHMRAPQLISISTFWLASNILWSAMLAIVLPAQVEAMLGADKAPGLGRMLSLGALFSLIVPLLVGPLSDRCTSKWGRRRPYMAVGVAINVVGLLTMLYFVLQRNYWGYVAGFIVVQLGNNIATG